MALEKNQNRETQENTTLRLNPIPREKSPQAAEISTQRLDSKMQNHKTTENTTLRLQPTREKAHKDAENATL
jgi:hypothetical protein